MGFPDFIADAGTFLLIFLRHGRGSGGSAQVDDATWLHTFFQDQFWVNPGGDFLPTYSRAGSVQDGLCPEGWVYRKASPDIS